MKKHLLSVILDRGYFFYNIFIESEFPKDYNEEKIDLNKLEFLFQLIQSFRLDYIKQR